MYKLYISFVILVVLISCTQEPKGLSPYLVMADSAIIHGRYDLAEKLVETYEGGNQNDNQENRHYKDLQMLKIKFLDSDISVSDYGCLDRLEKYYDKNDDYVNLCWALLCKSEIYSLQSDFPKALSFLLRAEELPMGSYSPILKGIIYENRGDVYFKQQMYDDCVDCYKTFYQIANSLNDSLRLAHASYRMGTVFTLQNNIDSTIYYLKQTQTLAKSYTQFDRIKQAALLQLCDIYIQIEEYEKAYELMPRDSFFTANWAYWHDGQNNNDSATFYFKRFLKQPSLQIQVEGLRKLIEISNRQNDKLQSLYYSSLLIEVNDSLKKLSQAEEIRRVEAQHQMNKFVLETEKRDRFQKGLLTVAFIFILFLASLTFLFFKRKVRKQLKKNKKRLNQIFEIKKKSEELSVDNQTRIVHREGTTELRKTSICQYVKQNAGKKEFRLTENQWEALGGAIDQAYDGFTDRIMEQSAVSELEMRVCYLTKIEISPTSMAELLCKSKSAITMLRSRLYRKLSGREGTAQQFDHWIMEL